jgi:6-phosphogluconolactonase
MIRTFANPEALADAVARYVAKCAEESIAATGRFVVALSGGSTPEAAYRQLATRGTRPTRAGLWRLTTVLWGDERCVPPDDPRSNYRMAKEALLDRVPIPPENVHRIRGEDDPEKAAADYERELSDPSLALRMTGLDLVLLGLGEDGHTASLFPGQSAVHETERWVRAVLAPDGKLWRVTLTPALINRAKNVCFVVSGANKAPTLERVLEQPFDPDVLPAQAIHPVQGRLTWMVDQAAAGRLKRLATRDS